MSAPLLEARGLTVGIGTVQAVCGFDLAVQGGERIAVLGRNGVGKSTLLAALAGLHPYQGSLAYAGRAAPEWPLAALARWRGWLSQHPDDPFASSVLDAVLVGRHPWLGRFDWEGDDDLRIAHAALQSLGLQGFAARNVQTLSGGERQRVAIATLLAQAARLYLLDEPLSHLDLASQMLVLERLSACAAAGAAVVMVIHDLNLALRWADRLVLLDGGGQWRCGATRELAEATILGYTLGYPLRALRCGDDIFFVPR